MGLFLGLGLIGAAFAMDIPKQSVYNKRAAKLNKYSNPASAEIIEAIARDKKDELGNSVWKYCRDHTGYDENGVYHNCFFEEAVFNLAREQCKRHGMEIGMKEAWYRCKCPEVRNFFGF